jgi:hypothetical protein
MLLLAITFISDASAQQQNKCCGLVITGTIVDHFLGGPGSPLVKKHKEICAEVNARWEKGLKGHSECITIPGLALDDQRLICMKSKTQKDCEQNTENRNGEPGKNYCIWKNNQCTANYAVFERMCAQVECSSKPVDTKGCCGLNDNLKNNSNASSLFQSCQRMSDSGACSKLGDPSTGSYCQWNSNNICPKPIDPNNGCCGINPEAKASTEKFYSTETALRVNKMLSACKVNDKNPQYCTGDCTWYEDKSQCQPLPVTNACCGISDGVRLNNKLIDDSARLLDIYNTCKVKSVDSCNESEFCQIHTDPKKCEKPEVRAPQGCCGVKKELRSSGSLLQMISVCSSNKEAVTCQANAAGPCEWFTNLNDCKISETNTKGPDSDISGTGVVNNTQRGSSGISATVACPTVCAAQATPSCPQKCEIECVPMNKLIRGNAINMLKTKQSSFIMNGSCADYARMESKGKTCKPVSCTPAKPN